MKRVLALPLLLLLAACGGLAPAKTQATAFQNPQTGQVVAGLRADAGLRGRYREGTARLHPILQDPRLATHGTPAGITGQVE